MLLDRLDYVVTVDEHDRVLTGASVLIEDGAITAVGEVDPAVAAGAERIDGRGRLALPGLVNLHTHLPMTLLRGLAEHVDLQGFLARVWAAEAALMDPDTVELGAQLGAVESLLAGCTTQLDMYFHHDQAHIGAAATGARHVGGPVFFDGEGPDGLRWAQRLRVLQEWPTRVAQLGGPHVPPAAMPHATYTCRPEHLREVAELVADWRGGVLHTHVSENAAENDDVTARYAARPVTLLHEAGWFDGPAHVVLGHGVHLDEADLTLVAAADAGLAHCPGSNLKLASGALNWQQVRRAGVRIGLGSDGCSSSNDLDLWQVMRQAALLGRLTSGRPDEAAAEQILRAATIDGARSLGMGGVIGSIEVGKRADITVLDIDAPHLTPVHDVAALLVFAAGRGDVVDVLVDGEQVVANRQSTRVDVPQLLARCRARAARARG